MRHDLSNTVVDQMHVRGTHEKTTTDTSYLARELSTFQDIGRLITDFDSGFTPLRDVGGMLVVQREAILDSYQANTVDDMAVTHPEILSMPVSALHERVVSGTQDQPIGHNFFVNATGFIDAGLPWAVKLGNLFRTRTNTSIHDMVNSGDIHGENRLLAAITENPDPELMTTMAVYLAGRSLEGEKFLGQHYSEDLKRAKEQVRISTQRIAATTGLSTGMVERALGQIQRTTFGSFDHLQGLVTTGDSGAAGDYLIGSLRVEIQFDGSVQAARLRKGYDANHVLAHEGQHSASAQANSRCGLQINGQGLQANEGMTEYLGQLSTDGRGIEQISGGGLSVKEGVPYRVPVLAMLALHEQFKSGKNEHFKNLFNTYHGEIIGQAQLEQSLDAFYEHDLAITNHLAG